jgi:hypothetical protein
VAHEGNTRLQKVKKRDGILREIVITGASYQGIFPV